ncbi:protein GAMETE CELL DEFECTIVE 1, mitochondrial [Impatiens glandulifera]|uniref:protein GAMETE CELL DEFECTIVE 1, mitochondrial n=1 Tax=Impatiens glandulifera TaxID=253017 RepID=UPI001FB09C22|nr:protein GAMETE CELL DEFECTIVE 1, mitochondrial [Impatiens glandulifera]
MNQLRGIFSITRKPTINLTTTITNLRRFSSKFTDVRSGSKNGDNDWNDAWESAWLPDDLSGKNRAPWEADVNYSLTNQINNSDDLVLQPDVDSDTKAFVEDMTDNWDQRRGTSKEKREKVEIKQQQEMVKGVGDKGMYSLENLKKDYRVKKQKIHAGLWVKEIEKQEEAKLGDFGVGGDDIDRLLDSCSEIFDSNNNDLQNTKIPAFSELKNKPDGWETTSKAPDGNVWEMSQREEDILVQEFERRIAFCKYQIASFIKTHIFSRRRPIDGWKYMIEEIGPNAKRGKGNVLRIPSLLDGSTQPFKEERRFVANDTTPFRKNK